MKVSRSVPALVTTCILLLTGRPALATPDSAILSYRIQGFITDAIGRALPQSVATDGLAQAQADSTGAYAFTRESTGTFYVWAFRSDTEIASKQIDVLLPIDTRVDFIVLYKITAALNRSALSTATSSASATLSILSRAPNPGTSASSQGYSCVIVHDSRTNSTSSASFSALNPDGSSNWSWSLSIPTLSTEGTYTLSTRAIDCATGVSLSAVSTTTYIVDNTRPVVPLANLTPKEGGNTMFDIQPLLAKASDPLSGVDPTSIRFTLFDTTLGISSQHSAVAYDSVTSWTKSANVTLVRGHIYRFSISVSDVAGNVTFGQHGPEAQGGGFLVTSFDASQAGIQTIGITNRPDAVQSVDLTTDRYVFNNPSYNRESVQLSLGGSRHTGPTVITWEVDSRWAVVRYDLLGLTPQVAPVEQTYQTVFGRIVYVDELASTTLVLGQAMYTLGLLSAILPKGAQNVRLEIPRVVIAPTAEVCSDPTASLRYCRPDPLLLQTEAAEAPNGASITVYGDSCVDRIIRIVGADVQYRVSEICGVTDVALSSGRPSTGPPEARACRSVDDLIVSLPGNSTTTCSGGTGGVPPPPPQHTYNHIYTWIEGFLGDLIAELESVSGHWWDGTYGWWYDANCCDGWAYGVAVDYWPHWDTTPPDVLFTDVVCSRSGPPSCAQRHSSAEIAERWWITGPEFDCAGVQNGVSVTHNHQLQSTGSLDPLILVSPCPGLTFHHDDFDDPDHPMGIFL